MKLFRCICLILMLAVAPAAYAKIAINTGNELFEVGPFPESVVKKYPHIKEKGLIVASLCDRLGVVDMDILTWNCRLVGSNLDTYSDLPDDVQAVVNAQYKVSDAKRDFLNHYGFWIVIAGSVAFVAYGEFFKKSKEPPKEEA